MATLIGVSETRSRDSAGAGAALSERALAKLGGKAPRLALLFATAAYDQGALVASVRAGTGGVPLVGCSAEGVISHAGSDEGSYAAALALIASDEMWFETYQAASFGEDSAGAARTLAEALRPRARDGKLLVLFPDGVVGNCRELIDTLTREVPGLPPVVGGTAGDLLRFEKTFQYRDENVSSGSVVALLVGGDMSVDFEVTHGCSLIGTEKTVTRAEGCFVYEIDHVPAWDFFKGYLDDDGAATLEAMHVAHLMLTERIKGQDAHFGDYTVRVPIRLDTSSGALYFAAGIEEGAVVQLALRHPAQVRTRAREAAERLLERSRGRRPSLVLQLDCAGRGRLLFGDDASAQLVAPQQEVLGRDVPWIGLHTYGEIAPVGGVTTFHNYSAILCALYAGA